jgi:hypothetical protein
MSVDPLMKERSRCQLHYFVKYLSQMDLPTSTCGLTILQEFYGEEEASTYGSSFTFVDQVLLSEFPLTSCILSC